MDREDMQLYTCEKCMKKISYLEKHEIKAGNKQFDFCNEHFKELSELLKDQVKDYISFSY